MSAEQITHIPDKIPFRAVVPLGSEPFNASMGIQPAPPEAPPVPIFDESYARLLDFNRSLQGATSIASPDDLARVIAGLRERPSALSKDNTASSPTTHNENPASDDDLLMGTIGSDKPVETPPVVTADRMILEPDSAFDGPLDHPEGFNPAGQVVGNDGVFGQLTQETLARGGHVPEEWIPLSLARAVTVVRPRRRPQEPPSVQATAHVPEPHYGGLALVRPGRPPAVFGEAPQSEQEGPSDSARHFGTDDGGAGSSQNQWGSRRPPREFRTEADDGAPTTVGYEVTTGGAGESRREATIGDIVDGSGKRLFTPLDTGGTSPTDASRLRQAHIGGIVPSGVPATRDSTARWPEPTPHKSLAAEPQPWGSVVSLLGLIAERKAAEDAAPELPENNGVAGTTVPAREIPMEATAAATPDTTEPTGEPFHEATPDVERPGNDIKKTTSASTSLHYFGEVRRRLSTMPPGRRRRAGILGATGAAIVVAYLNRRRG